MGIVLVDGDQARLTGHRAPLSGNAAELKIGGGGVGVVALAPSQGPSTHRDFFHPLHPEQLLAF